MRFLAVVIVAATASGCVRAIPIQESDKTTVVDGIVYVREPRADLCFAVLVSPGSGFSLAVAIAAVPDSACIKAGDTK